MEVIVPKRKNPLVRMAKWIISPTTGSEIERGEGTPPSVCMLNVESKCKRGNFCMQIHITKLNYDRIIREGLTEKKRCCIHHAEKCREGAWPIVRIYNRKMKFVDIPLVRTEKTNYKGCSSLEKGGYVPVSQVCRKKMEGTCLYGKYCNYFHICDDYIKKVSKITRAIPPLRTQGLPEEGEFKPPSILGMKTEEVSNLPKISTPEFKDKAEKTPESPRTIWNKKFLELLEKSAKCKEQNLEGGMISVHPLLLFSSVFRYREGVDW